MFGKRNNLRQKNLEQISDAAEDYVTAHRGALVVTSENEEYKIASKRLCELLEVRDSLSQSKRETLMHYLGKSSNDGK